MAERPTTCETCKRPLKQRRRGRIVRFCKAACVPIELRREAGRRGRVTYARQQRIRRYLTELARLRALPRITAEDITVSLAAVELRGWTNGYAAADKKWRGRHGKAA